MRATVYVYPDGLPGELVEEKDRVARQIGNNSYGPRNNVMRISGVPLHARLETPFHAGWLVQEWMRQPDRTEGRMRFGSGLPGAIVTKWVGE
ncbi:hypothetical protein MAMT_02182 [Methylacidimicrobium tartarophylax]|uniref:Uncharacterized protein n=1 Tax=Methylacidimicrobium tartarophylax TaxID=1041768 RepID=A0A5E6MIY7_9BACT|nr:hypothetical protein MAMT_02182 [Methylacidimicrobium tartarophylax]